MRNSSFIISIISLIMFMSYKAILLNDILFGARYEIKNNIYLQMEGGINNLISFGTPFNTFLKMGIGLNL